MQRQDVVQVPRLEPRDLFDKRSKRDFARLRAYNQLLEQIYHRIYASSQLSGNTASITYSVPPFILGLPKLDLQDTIVYLVLQLRNGGYEVRYTYPNLLWISWKHHETEYLSKANPIIQAMVPEKPKPKINLNPLPQLVSKPKKQQQEKVKLNTTVTFNDDVSLINGLESPSSFSQFGIPPSSGSRPIPRKAADYQPPESFLQTMDKPVKPKPTNKTSILEDLWNV
jgi:hypothetical protein